MYSVPPAYFDTHDWNINIVKAGDIIAFGVSHVAYVASKSSSTTDGIKLDQAEYEGGPIRTGYTLQQTIDGVRQGGEWIVHPRGQPTAYYTLKPKFKFILQNELGDGSHGGKVKLDTGNEEDSPWTTPYLHWDSNHTLHAVMEGRTHGGYVQRLKEWTKGELYLGDLLHQPMTINWNLGQPTIKAKYRNEYDITFRNQFIGVSGYPGTIKVNGSTKDSPHVEKVLKDDPVTGQAVWQVYNHIEYTFSQWSDGYTSASRTFIPTDHGTYTANFTGKPRPMTYYGLHTNTTPGEHVTLYWDTHPNPNVTQYKIWRKMKEGGTGHMYGPYLLATVNRGTTSYTDYGVVITSGYTDDIFWYDVRAYYATEATYADPDYIAIFGDGNRNPKTGKDSLQTDSNPAALPSTFEITAYPNPFNPTTTLRYQLKEPAYVTLTIYDMLGRKVTTLVETEQSAGYYSIQWSAADAANTRVTSGVYFYQFIATSTGWQDIFRKSGKLLLVK